MSLFGWGKKAKKDDRRAKESKKASDMSPSPSQMKEDVASRHALEKMAYDGNAEALYQLGLLHETGRWDIPQSAATAFRYFQWAAEAGYSRAILKVAECCCRGTGVDMDPDRAIALLRQAERDGVEGAGEALQKALDFQGGMKYALGAQDEDGPDEEAPEIPRPSAPDPKQERRRLVSDAVAAYKTGRYEEAFTGFHTAAVLGDGAALYALGVMCDGGEGLSAPDHARAFSCFGKAMNAGYPDAVLEVAKSYFFGRGTEQDTRRALDLLEKAAADGMKDAQALREQMVRQLEREAAEEAAARGAATRMAAARE